MTLAKYFDRLRHESGLSLREIGAKCRPKMHPATLWKICHGKPVKADTVGVALRALGYSERDHTYLEAFALWSTEQAQTIPADSFGKSLETLRGKQCREFDRMLEKLAAALKAMPEADWPIVLEAAQRPAALKLWLQSLKA